MCSGSVPFVLLASVGTSKGSVPFAEGSSLEAEDSSLDDDSPMDDEGCLFDEDVDFMVVDSVAALVPAFPPACGLAAPG